MKTGLLTKILASAGTALMWLPILAPALATVALLLLERIFRFDYLMPAELFPAVLIGGGLLIWAALRARARRKLIGWGFAGAVVLLFGAQGLAEVSGLASGETEIGGFWWALVLTMLVLYVLAIFVLGVGGVLLLRDLFNPANRPPSAKAQNAAALDA